MEKHVIGIDIGGTNVRIAHASLQGEIKDFVRVSSKDIFTGINPSENLGRFINKYIDHYCHDIHVDCITIGIPGALSGDRRIILQVPNIEGMDNIPMKDELESFLGIKVELEKDTNMLYFWDMYNEKISSKGINIGIYIGTGVGNAIFIEGKPLIGKDGAAGELGHIPMIGGTEKCGCGNVGCSECYGSGWKLVELKNKYFPEISMEDLFEQKWNTDILRKFVDDIACISCSEINILNPNTIVFGGGVINMKGFPKELLLDRLKVHARKPYPAENMEIMFSEDKVDNGVKGAILFAKNLVENQ